MKLALYHPWVYLRGGIERLLLELVEHSRHDWTIYTHHYEPESTFDGFRDVDVRELSPRVEVRRSLKPLAHAARTIARTDLPADGSRALLVSSEGLGDFVVNRARVPVAAYCHTPLKIYHDPAARACVKRNGGKQRAALNVLGPAFNALDRRMWRRYRHVFCNSNETLERCLRAGLRPSGEMDVLYPAVDGALFYDDGGEREPFLLAAGRIMWQKNLELAIETVRRLAERRRPMKLVIAGTVDEKSRAYYEHLRWLARDLDVEFRVGPSDAELAHLYRRCQALLFTPWNEDFGIVSLEAMSSGAPVLAVDSGGPRETVIPWRTGWLLPNDASAFADAVEEMRAQPAWVAVMRRQARERAQQFAWRNFASTIDDVMGELATERARVPAVRVPSPVLSGLRAAPISREPTVAPQRQ